MLGAKAKCLQSHASVSLEDLVPPDNFYRLLEAKLDLSFVRELVRDYFCSGIGRPSIDPVVFFKLQLIMFFEGSRSERQLMDMVHLHLAYRWYLGYDLGERVPDHSSLSKIRDRYDLEVFQRFFEQMVQCCVEAGLVWGQELYIDGTRVRANADIDHQVPRFYWDAQQHVQTLFSRTRVQEQEDPPSSSETQSAPRTLVEKYDGTRLVDHEPYYERLADGWVNTTDPSATPLMPTGEEQHKLGYHDHYVVDGGKARIILAALVTPASIHDPTPMLDLARWVRFRWQLSPEIAVGDGRYGTMTNIVGVERDGMRAYLARPDHRSRTGVYPQRSFTYDPQQDCYLCPQRQRLPRSSSDARKAATIYRAPAKVCKRCPVKPQCTKGRYGRVIQRLPFQEVLDRAWNYVETEAYQKAMRKRMVWIEPLFGEAKQWHHLGRFRLRGLGKVNIEALMIATGQNLKRLLRARQGSQPGNSTRGAFRPVVSPKLCACPTPGLS
jgi:transposase